MLVITKPHLVIFSPLEGHDQCLFMIDVLWCAPLSIVSLHTSEIKMEFETILYVFLYIWIVALFYLWIKWGRNFKCIGRKMEIHITTGERAN